MGSGDWGVHFFIHCQLTGIGGLLSVENEKKMREDCPFLK